MAINFSCNYKWILCITINFFSHLHFSNLDIFVYVIQALVDSDLQNVTIFYKRITVVTSAKIIILKFCESVIYNIKDWNPFLNYYTLPIVLYCLRAEVISIILRWYSGISFQIIAVKTSFHLAKLNPFLSSMTTRVDNSMFYCNGCLRLHPLQNVPTTSKLPVH